MIDCLFKITSYAILLILTGQNKTKIELLHFDGCPSWQIGLENMKAALPAERPDASAELAVALNDDGATLTKFGSNVVVKPLAKTVARIAKSLGVFTKDSVK